MSSLPHIIILHSAGEVNIGFDLFKPISRLVADISPVLIIEPIIGATLIVSVFYD